MGESNRAIAGLVGLIALLLVGCGISVICLVRYNLASVYWVCPPPYFYWWCYTATFSCFIGSNPQDNSNCYYAYAIGSVGIFWAALFCCTRAKESAAAAMAELFLALCSVGWWVAGAIVMTQQSQLADDNDFPNPTYRDGVIAVCWTAVGLSGLIAVMSVLYCLASRKGGKKHDHHDHHHAPPPQAEAYVVPPPQPQPQPQPLYVQQPAPVPQYAPPPQPGAYYAPPPPQGGYYPPPPQQAYQVSYPPPR